jgi:hypothetical protein
MLFWINRVFLGDDEQIDDESIWSVVLWGKFNWTFLGYKPNKKLQKSQIFTLHSSKLVATCSMGIFKTKCLNPFENKISILEFYKGKQECVQ